MAIFTAAAALIGAVGAGIGAIGAGAAALAAGVGSVGVGGLLTAGSLAVSAYGAYGQYSAAQQAASASRRAEALRRQQTQLELNNRYITRLREFQQARANNLTKGTSQGGSGAIFGSALANSNASVESALGYTLSTEGTVGSIGFGIYDANADFAEAQSKGSIASGISNLGGSIAGNLGAIERVGNYMTGGAFQNWSNSTTVSYG